MKKVKAESADSAFFSNFVKKISNDEKNKFFCCRCDGSLDVLF